MLKWLINQLWARKPDPTEPWRRMMRNCDTVCTVDPLGLGEAVAVIPIELIGGPYDGSEFPMPAPYYGIEDELVVPMSRDRKTVALYHRPSLDARVAHFVETGELGVDIKSDTD